MIIEADDFGCNHIISDMCQSHDCRDVLDRLHLVNPNFKITLFAIPWEMTPELALWCARNNSWVQLGVHGFGHTSNYECEKMTYEEMEQNLQLVWGMWPTSFVRVFRAPGWQISDDCLKYLADHDWIIADQGYNDSRRPKNARAYINYSGRFIVKTFTQNKLGGSKIPVEKEVEATHHHVWDCMGNGLYEQEEYLKDLLSKRNDFQFITELF